MTELDPKRLLAEAEANGRVFRIKSGWRGFIYFAAVLMCILVITLPFGIWFFIVARRARVGLTDEGFAVSWFLTKAYAWEDIESFQPQRLHFNAAGQGGLVGALAVAAAGAVIAKKTQGLKGPLMFKLKGKRGQRAIQAHAVENSLEMARQMEQHTNLVILEPEGEQAG